MKRPGILSGLVQGCVLAVLLFSVACGSKEMARNQESERIGSLPEVALLAGLKTHGALYVVIDTPYQIYGSASSKIHVAAWTLEGDPAANAEVYLGSELVGTTGPHGALVFDWEAQAGNTSQERISVRWRAPDNKIREGSVAFSPFGRTRSFGSNQLYVYTDRGVYAPGDKVQMRLLAWEIEADYRPIHNAEVEATLQGPRGETVTGALVTTDELGIAWSSLDLPDTLEEGLYTLVISWGRARATATLRVERFVLPVIQINHTLGRFLTPDTPSLSWEVELSHVGGGPLTRAQMTVEVKALGEMLYLAHEAIEGEGPHTLTLPPGVLDDLEGRLEDRQRFEIRMTVEDELGRVDSLTRDITWAENPYVVVIEADKDAWAAGEAVELMVRVTDVERVPLRNGLLRLETSRQETMEAETDANGIAHFTLEMRSSSFEVQIFVPGVGRVAANRFLGHREIPPMASHIERPVVREREPVTVRVRFPSDYVPVESVVHLDVTDTSGGIAQAALLPVYWEDGVPYAQGSFEAPAWGSMLLTFFCLGEQVGAVPVSRGVRPLGVLTAGQNLAVHPNRVLDIQLSGIPARMEPGSEMALGFEIRDAMGRPVDAAVGVTVVDEGVISLKDPLEITPMDIFYNPELRVISTTGSAILTWPVVSRNWGEHRDDFALPPFNFARPGEVFRQNARRNSNAVADYGEPEEMGTGVGMAVGGVMAEPSPMSAPAPSPTTARRPREPGSDASAADDALPTITIRTEAPETTLWAPDLRVRNGRGGVQAPGPTAPSRQQLIVVASDANGGVGVQRLSFDVAMPLAARSDLPATLRRGESLDAQIAVTNNTERRERVTLWLRSDDLVVEGEPVALDVPAGETRTARVRVHAPRAGDARYAVFAQGRQLGDAVTGTLRVLPAGERERNLQAGVMQDGSLTLHLPAAPDAVWREASLRVMFPAVSTAFAGADALIERLERESIEALSGDLTTAIMIWGQRRAEGGAEANQWRDRLQRVVSLVVMLQAADGGWRPPWAASSQLAVSVWSLEALVEAKRAGLQVPDGALRAAVRFVAATIAQEEIAVDDISFWEGSSRAVQEGLRAQAVHVLAKTPLVHQDTELLAQLGEIVASALEASQGPEPDLLTTAHFLGAASILASKGVEGVDLELVHARARRLVEQRREGHWEPSWFNAWGGQIEASVVILQVLRDLQVPGADALEREVLRSLMGTASSLGSWHNESGSAWLLRALALFPSNEPISAESLVVSVDGQEFKRVSLDARDPYRSALELRMLDLSPQARAGAGRIEVRLEGSAAGSESVRVELVDDLWRD